MQIGILSLIPWQFIKQRPHEFAEGLVRLGHTVYYFEPFIWRRKPLEIAEALRRSFEPIPAGERLYLVRPVLVPPFRHTVQALKYNRFFLAVVRRIFARLGLDFLIVLETEYADAVIQSGIPFAYDHVDDTQFMDYVHAERFVENMNRLKKESRFNIYIQEAAARKDAKGFFLANGISEQEFFPVDVPKRFDAVVLSNMAKWFDMDSILESKKEIVLIGPMDIDWGDNYQRFSAARKNNLLYVPQIEKRIAVSWLNRARVGLVPFKEQHPVVSYAMPIKILEYFLCNLRVVTFWNEGIAQQYGDLVTFYSRSNGWPSLDEAIDQASKRMPEDLRSFALQFRWSDLVARLDSKIRSSGASD